MGQYAKIQWLGTGRTDREMAGQKRYKLTRKDDHGNPIQLTSFANRDEQVEAMMVLDEDGRCAYDHDPVYRETVNDISANSTFSEPTLAKRSPIPDNETFLAALKRDALIQRRAELTEAAGGSDAIAKYNAALALTDPENFDSAMEMQEATEVATPYADYMRQRKAEGLGPMQSANLEELLNQPAEGATAGADDDGAIITVEGN